MGTLNLLGGEAKGFSLSVPRGTLTRPTPVLLRRRLFDFRQDWREWAFVDLCAGVGTVGLEAWSRGACPVELVESSSGVFRHLKKNVEKLSALGGRLLVPFSGTVKDFLRAGRGRPEGRSICWFLDPPYQKGDVYESAFSGVMDRMEGEDELWVQTGEGSVFQTKSRSLKSFVQGGNRLDCYQKEGG